MTSDTPRSPLPLMRLVIAQGYAIAYASKFHSPGMTLCGSSLSFRPDMMRRVAEEAPVLTEIDRLKNLRIWTPEQPERIGCDWALRVDLSWISETWSDGLAYSWFNEFAVYAQGPLEQLTDPAINFDAMLSLSIVPPIWDCATS